MNFFDAFILGIIEGVTEFLPVSSTGHLILAGRLMDLPETEFLKIFDISIQLGAILAVVILYGRTFLLNIEVLKRLLAAFIPTVIVGGIFYQGIKDFLLGNSDVVIWSLFLGGVFLIIFEMLHKEGDKEDLTEISYQDAVLIGLFQSIAMIPGISRAAATIVGGLFLGMKRKAIVEFSFLLAVPTMVAACALVLFKNQQELLAVPDALPLLLVGFVTSFIVAVASIKSFLYFIQWNNFIPFGVYRILVAVVFWLFG